MPFTIDSDFDGRFVVRLDSEPEFIHGFWMAPSAREKCLDAGDWVVLAFAVWNIQDRAAIDCAINAIKVINGRISLGIRPFEATDEFAKWCLIDAEPSESIDVSQQRTTGGLKISITPVAGRTPIWVLIRDGAIVHYHNGLLSSFEIRAIIDKYLG
jgi:hypothetical protein